jgi:RNA polymerase sigma-70 factor (ECF subfamily)
MADSDWLAAAVEEHRDHLRAVAYRLLGSVTDADDAVQDTWLRLTGADTSEVENLGGWLTTVVARVSLNMLRSRRHLHEEPVGNTWPGGAELAASAGAAAVFGRSTEATRQLASRARRRVRGAPSPDRAADLARQREVATAFLAASRAGDFSALVALLDSDVMLTADAFAAPVGRPVTLRGAEMVARGAVAAYARAGHSRLALVNGSVGIVFAPAGRLQVVLAVTVSAERRVTAIDVIADPDRLRRLQLALLPD